jgi:general secretion pathway protein A
MFLDFYNLKEQPFSEAPDPRQLYLSATHREALASLFYGIETGRGFLTLIAEPGMGKTTLLFHLRERLKDSARTVFLFQTQCKARELLPCLLSDLGIEAQGRNLGWMHEQLKGILLVEANAGRRVLVFIDEAQNLRDSALETVRLLSNFETTRSKLMQIILAGQPQLAETLTRPNLVQLRQRISIVSRLRRFTPAETNTYIDYRLRLAGFEGRRLFTPGALEMIEAWSNGVPRNINNVCFNALTLGYAMGLRQIDRSVVQEVLTDLRLDQLILKQHGSDEPIESASPVSRSSSFRPSQAQSKGGLGARRTLSLAAALLLLAAVGWMTATGRLWRTGYMRSIEVPKSSLPPNVDSLLPQTDGSQSNQEYRSLRTRPVPTTSGYHKSGHAIGPYRDAGVPAQSFSSVLPP